jgi:hypothetical protein
MMEMLKWGVAAMLLTLFATAQASAVSQWWVSRSSSAVVTLASPNTLGHSPKARLVVTMIGVRS